MKIGDVLYRYEDDIYGDYPLYVSKFKLVKYEIIKETECYYHLSIKGSEDIVKKMRKIVVTTPYARSTKEEALADYKVRKNNQLRVLETKITATRERLSRLDGEYEEDIYI